MTRDARTSIAGEAEGPAVVLAAPLSFWGGIDIETGRIIDRSHPDHGVSVTGTVLVMPGGRGSSSSSSVLAETLRRGTGPVAIVLASPDPILCTGAIVAEILYGVRCPIVVCAIDAFASGEFVRVSASADQASVIAGPL